MLAFRAPMDPFPRTLTIFFIQSATGIAPLRKQRNANKVVYVDVLNAEKPKLKETKTKEDSYYSIASFDPPKKKKRVSRKYTPKRKKKNIPRSLPLAILVRMRGIYFAKRNGTEENSVVSSIRESDLYLLLGRSPEGSGRTAWPST